MKKRTSSVVPIIGVSNKYTNQSILDFITKNINKSSIETRRIILRYIMDKLPNDKCHEHNDGCRIIINELETSDLEKILELILENIE